MASGPSRSSASDSLHASLARQIETPRLTLELFDYSEAHYDVLLSVLNDPVTHKQLGDFGIRTPAAFDDMNRGCRLNPSLTGGKIADCDAYWIVSLKLTTDEPTGTQKVEAKSPLIGGVSLMQRSPNFPPDIGWVFSSEYHGRGYATEASKALLKWATDKDHGMGLQKILAWPGSGNQGSRRVAEKIGMVEVGEITMRLKTRVTGDDGEEAVKETMDAALTYVLPDMVQEWREKMASSEGIVVEIWGE